jgi:DNA modification methylase
LMRGEHVVGQRDARRGAFAPPSGEYEYPVEQLQEASGTSIFDPVLCELAYTWFAPLTGAVLDPFAGGSVRGIVAACLGRKYTGVDLRPEQVQANEAQAAEIVPHNPPTWIVGDSQDAMPAGPFDFVFSCPPYYDLEIYSDDPADLSNMEYTAFLAAYRSIIAQAVARLADNRFACFVVGDVRDKKGMYRNFVSETIAAFQDAGAVLYNEAILVTAVGSLPIRVGKQFSSGRKLGKTHQNVLVFVKGDPRKATAFCGPVEVMDLDDANSDFTVIDNG